MTAWGQQAAPFPMAELHCHIEGTASPELARRQAARDGVDLSNLLEGDRYLWREFGEFLTAYDRVANLFRSEEDYAGLCFDYLSRIARAGAIYAELFVSPDHARMAGLSEEAYLSGLSEGARRAEQETGILSRFIVVGLRHLGPQAVEAAARSAASASVRFPVTGFGLAGDERMHRPADFGRAFEIARDAGLGLTAHAGEWHGPDGIRETLDALKVSRLGHGVRAIEDADLVRRIAADGIVLETCPGSNLALRVYPDATSHPLRPLQEAGCRITVNSDDPPFFGTDLAAEYAFARAQGFSDAERLALTRNALEAAFLDETSRKSLLDRFLMNAISLGAPAASR